MTRQNTTAGAAVRSFSAKQSAGRAFMATLCALMLSLVGATTAMAQTATSSEPNGGQVAGNALDGNLGTRWESKQGSDDAWWQVDYGEAKDFNYVVINWEGAYAKSFKIYGTNDTDKANNTTNQNGWDELVNVTDQTLADKQYNTPIYYGISKTGPYRYLRFVGIKRATQYGYSFYEFNVATKSGDLRDASLSSSLIAEGHTAKITVRGRHDGTPFEPNLLNYEVSGTLFDLETPLGSVDEETGVFTPAMAGEGTVVITLKDPTDMVGKDRVWVTPIVVPVKSLAGDLSDNSTETTVPLASNYYQCSYLIVDLGETKSFEAVHIDWAEDRISTDYKIFGFSDINDIEHTMKELAYLKLTTQTQNFNVGQQQYRYLLIEDWTGNAAIAEIDFYTPALQSLKSITKANNNPMKVGSRRALTVTGTDQYGADMPVDITNEAVTFSYSPTDIGHVDRTTGEFVVDKPYFGKVTITAKFGTSSKTVDVYVCDGAYFKGFVHTRGTIDAAAPGIIDGNCIEANIPAGREADFKNYYTVADDSRITTNASGSHIYDIADKATNPVTDGIRQKTHVTEHYIYAMPGETIYLLPYSDFHTTNIGNYRAVIMRWYDYATDLKHNWLSMRYDGEQYGNIDTPWGIMSGTGLVGQDKASGTMAKLTIPADAGNFGKIYIALDASLSDTNGVDQLHLNWVSKAGDTNWYEPLVKFRHIFIIENAAAYAEEFSEKNAEYVKGRKRFITARENVAFHVRLDDMLSTSKDVKSGIYYKKSDGTIDHVRSAYVLTTKPDGSTATNYFNLDHKRGGTSINVSENKEFYRTVSCSAGNAKKGKYKVQVIGMDASGKAITVGGKELVIQEYEISFVDESQASFLNEEELTDAKRDALKHQEYGYLNAHFGDPIDVINYDQFPLTGNAVTSESSKKYYRWPLPWDDCNYSCGYTEPHDWAIYRVATHSSVTAYHAASDKWPKEKNFPGSTYNPGSSAGQFDRLFYESKGEQQGYFYYVNGAGDPGIIARINIDNFCLGSTLYVSGWVSEMSESTDKADIIFNFNVVLNDGRSITLHSFTPGAIPDNAHCGKWTRMYYSFVPNTTHIPFNAGDILRYELLVENNCTGSSGADYAIDDIRVWASKPAIYAQQNGPVCHGEKKADIKIRVSFESLLASMGLVPESGDGTDLKCYYTVIDKDKWDGMTSEQQVSNFASAVVRYKYNASEDNDNAGFGKLTFNTNWINHDTYTFGNIGKAKAMKELVDGQEWLVFDTQPADSKFYTGKEYIIALWAPELGRLAEGEDESVEETILNYAHFLINETCAKICVFRVHGSGIVKVNGKVVTNEDEISVCENQSPVVSLDAYGMVSSQDLNHSSDDSQTSLDESEKEYDQPVVIDKNALYDWYDGDYQEYITAKSADGTVELDKAIHLFRQYYPDHTDFEGVVPANHILDNGNEPLVFTQPMIDYLKSLTEVGTNGRAKLLLYKRSCIMSPGIVNGRKACYIVAIPIMREKYIINIDGEIYEFGAKDILVCTDPSEIRVYFNSVAPHLLHGFAKDVNYPATMEDVPLRIGLHQLESASFAHASMKSWASTLTGNVSTFGNHFLNIPIRRITTTNDALTTLKRGSDIVVYLAETNDPEYMDLGGKLENLVTPADATADDAILLPQIGLLLNLAADKTADANAFSVVFSEDWKFKEGYYYRLLFQYAEAYPASYAGDRTDCDGQLIYTLKVVPKYQMWVGGSSTDYNNDRNWRRVTYGELNLNENDGEESRTLIYNNINRVIDGYADATNNGDAEAFKREQNSIKARRSTTSYAPLDFTDILVPNIDAYPRMYGVKTTDITVFDGLAKNTYAWPAGGYGTDGEGNVVYTAANDALPQTSTRDIQYDMAAFYDGGETTNPVYCRPWYANTCEHVTFLPGGEMFQQQYLNYQRAWVELEVAPDRWYTLTSPLQKTVAGDMYLPTIGTRAPGRQVSPHFLPITYSDTRNDRFRPAVYQRSWDHNGSANIYRMSADGLAGGGGVDNAAVAAHWSHVYNDVEEIYTEGKGFSIKTDVSRLDPADQPANVLFRLPKDDATYYYHNSVLPQQNYSGTVKGDQTNIDRGRVYSANVPRQSRLNEVNGTITVSTQTAGKYFLVGNPFMSHLDMDKFFKENSDKIERKFWILTGNRQESVIMDGEEAIATDANVSVPPMQAFFVEAKDAATSIELKYEEDMMKNFPIYVINADGSQTPGTVNPNVQPGDVRPGLQMPASRSGVATSGQLRILLSDADELVSTAVVALAPMASSDYCESEDAILLLDSNLDEQSALYTVAGSTAVTINRLERVGTVPLGIICEDDEAAKKMLTLTFDGADIFPQPLYLYDAQSGETTPIEDGMTVYVPARSAGQYFITTGIDEVEEGAEASGPIYNLKGIRVANTNNERVLIQNGRKMVAH